ncbi:10056_t:CDS:2, partial [Gigaspora rosea]
EELHVKFQSMSTQKKNKESHSTKMDSSTHVKVQKDITASRWAPQNKARDTSTKQTQIAQLDESLPNMLKGKSLAIKEHKPSRESTPETEPSTSTWQGNIRERNGRKHQEQTTSHQRRGRSPYKFDKTNYAKVVHTTDKRTQIPHMAQTTHSAPVQSKITRERSSQHRQSRLVQQTSKEHSTSPSQTSGQILASCDN